MKQALPTHNQNHGEPADIGVSLVIPVRDEVASIPALTENILAVMQDWAPFEIIYVDDGSLDGSPALLKELCARQEIRAIRHRQSAGQSAAVRTGVLAARAPVIVTLDGDGQNDPADIPRLLDVLSAPTLPRPGLVQGERSRRQDGRWKRLSSWLANRLRRTLIGDGAQDSGCALRAFHRQTYLALPYFDHLHRYMPAMIKREGVEVVYVPVSHHPRQSGRSHYGTFDRLFAGLADLFGVWWLIRRRHLPDCEELAAPDDLHR